jgi:hypothetical protein
VTVTRDEQHLVDETGFDGDLLRLISICVPALQRHQSIEKARQYVDFLWEIAAWEETVFAASALAETVTGQLCLLMARVDRATLEISDQPWRVGPESRIVDEYRDALEEAFSHPNAVGRVDVLRELCESPEEICKYETITPTAMQRWQKRVSSLLAGLNTRGTVA